MPMSKDDDPACPICGGAWARSAPRDLIDPPDAFDGLSWDEKVLRLNKNPDEYDLTAYSTCENGHLFPEARLVGGESR